ncbi:hypothetical protein MVEN_00354900 [Mycena venus]|uniref:F-box domain-containing protein n=1 Tax=Mycena venus TaxID=2733690 RepID=A0A8H6YU52_9AGAR|nr:hypothetical protein MVEN_00354900 [Mycena venus]
MFFRDSVSPFADKLGTNYVPSDSEILEIRALIRDPAEELGRIEAQIDGMELAIGQLKAKRASLKTAIDAHRALISPMRHVPLDVLQEIFFSCLSSEHYALMDPAEAPLLLGRICRHWRRVAYSTPMLWSSIHIPSPDLHHHSVNLLLRMERIVEAWLERSAACPLSVSVSDLNVPVESNTEIHPLVFQLLYVAHRLHRLALSGDARLFRPLLRLGPEALPLLESIRIQTNGIAMFDDHYNATSALQIPTMVDVSLCISDPIDPLSLPLRWSQLTALSLQCYCVWKDHGPEGGSRHWWSVRRASKVSEPSSVRTANDQDFRRSWISPGYNANYPTPDAYPCLHRFISI